MKANIHYMAVEITRKCNMKCAHCMRGKAQNKDISTQILDTLTNQIKSIEGLIFTGGEPSLNPKGISTFLDLCIKKKTTINATGILTNGKRYTQEFIEVAKRLFSFCSCTSEYFRKGIWVSISKWHCENGQNKQEIKELEVLSPYFKQTSPLKEYNVFNEGRAKENKIGVIPTHNNENKLIYINAKGFVLKQGNLSYKNQEKHILGHINNLDLTFLS